MSTENMTKINRLLGTLPNGVVLLSSSLALQGYSLNLQRRYRDSHWLESIGHGAMIRAGDQVGYDGAMYALQEAGWSIHPGGITALSILGQAHYLSLSAKKVTVFGSKEEKLPAWFQKRNWGVKVDYYQSEFLPANVGTITFQVKEFKIKISGAARALMECLYLAPKKQELVECYELMEGQNNLRPDIVQALLEQCTSVKVKRLFMYMAEKANHTWVEYIDLEKIDFGSGKRSIVKSGIYDPKYKITLPHELGQHGRSL